PGRRRSRGAERTGTGVADVAANVAAEGAVRVTPERAVVEVLATGRDRTGGLAGGAGRGDAEQAGEEAAAGWRGGHRRCSFRGGAKFSSQTRARSAVS